jgi:hypothetical protein
MAQEQTRCRPRVRSPVTKDEYMRVAESLIAQYRKEFDPYSPPGTFTSEKARVLCSVITDHAKNFDPSWYRSPMT